MIKLTSQEIERLRDIRIHRIIGLPDTGRRVSIPCPIHGGKNDNFNVYDNNSYHCFKCGANGYGAIDFCRDLGFSFVDSLGELVKYL
jgi:DNA primase